MKTNKEIIYEGLTEILIEIEKSHGEKSEVSEKLKKIIEDFNLLY